MSLRYIPSSTTGGNRDTYDYQLDDACLGDPAAVSIVTVVSYQGAEWISEIAQSLMLQSMQNFDWFILEELTQEQIDCSTLEYCKGMNATRIHRVSYFNKDASSCIKALSQAAGSYVCFLDPFAIIDPTYLEKCVWFLETNPQFVFCSSLSKKLGGELVSDDCAVEAGLAYILNESNSARFIVVRRDSVMKFLQTEDILINGVGISQLLLSVAEGGGWGATIPECLCWFRPGNNQGEHNNLDAIIENKYSKLLSDFPVVTSLEQHPYSEMQINSLINNPLYLSAGSFRILLLIPWMVTGGADKFNLDLLELLVEKGYEVTVCATVAAEHPWEYRFSNLTPDIFVLRRFLEPADIPRFLAYLIKSRKINSVVISGSSIGYQLLPYLRASAPETSFLDLNHVEEPHWQSGGHPRFGVGYQDLLDLSIVSTKHLSKWMVGRGADPDRIRVLYTGVDEFKKSTIRAKRESIRKEFALSDDYPVMIFGGRICKQKRPDMLAKILKALDEKGLDFYMFVVGDGDQRPMFESMIESAGLSSSVCMCGSVSHDRWLELLQASDIFLLPSDYEGISIALLEAMSVGVVPVASDVGGQKEIVQQGAGYLVSHGENERDEYVAVLNGLLINYELRKEMGQSARELIARYFSKHSTIESFERIVCESQQLLKTSPRVLIPIGLAKELATSAIELNRLNDAVHWLWGRGDGHEVVGGLSSLMNWLLFVRQSKIGVVLSKSKFLRRIIAFFAH